MKGKILIAFFISVILLSIIPYDSITVSATTITYPFGFESTVSGTQVNFTNPVTNTIFKTEKKSGTTFQIYSTGMRSGTRCFYSSGSGIGYLNLTYPTSNYLTGFKIYVNVASTGSSYIYLYNKTLGLVNGLFAKVFYEGSSDKVYYVNDIGSNVQFSTSGSATGYKSLNITFDNNIGDVTYYVDSQHSHGVARIPSLVSGNNRIDSVYLECVSDTRYIDDINITISNSYNIGGGVTSCGYDLNSYQKIGIDNTPNTADIVGYQLMKIYNVYTTGTLNGVSLCVSPTQYAYDSNLNNYTCTLLGFDLGSADCFDSDGFNYRLFWSSSIDLGDYSSENQQSGYLLYAQFFHTKKIFGNTYWQVCIGSQGSDLDSDGNTYFKYGSTTAVPQTRYDRDLGVSFYLTGALHNATYGYTDRLGLHNYVGSNSTGFQYYLGQPEGIVCSYLLGSSAYNYKLEIYRNISTLVETYFNLQYPSGVIGYIPTVIGRYTFKLYSFHYVYNITAFVSGTLPDFYIYTNPVITSPFQTYTIGYKYYHYQGLTGIIGIFHNQEDCNDFSKSYQHIDISNNITSTVPYSSSATENEYLTLFVNNSQKSPVAYAIHVIRNPNIAENYILVSKENIEIEKGNPNAISVNIYGNHLFPLCDIGIYIDGALKKSVKYEQIFSYDYVPLLGGEHNISLRVMMNGTLTTVSHCHLTVTIATPEDNGGGGDIGGLLPPPYSYILGAIITIVLMILPSIALGKIGISGSESLKYVPIFSGTMGFILSCLIGLFPWYSIFALLFVLILIITVLYLSKNKQ